MPRIVKQPLRGVAWRGRELEDQHRVDQAVSLLERLRCGVVELLQDLANGTEAETARANRAFARTQRAIEAYANFKVPPKKLTVETSGAIRQAKGLLAFLDQTFGGHGYTIPVQVKAPAGANGGLYNLLGGPTLRNNDGTLNRDGNPKTGKGKAAGGQIETRTRTEVPRFDDLTRSAA